MGYDLSSKVKTANPLAGTITKESTSEQLSAYWAKERELHNYERFNVFAWTMVLNLAVMYGWKPAGTLPGWRYYMTDLPNLNPDDWDGNYEENAGQTVTSEDAAALADALEKSLDDIPDVNTIDKDTSEAFVDFFIILGKPTIDAISGDISFENIEIPKRREVNVFDYFSGDNKLHLISFIAFCRKGAFLIK